jgi:succinyl-CoA synthetase alpha subunit
VAVSATLVRRNAYVDSVTLLQVTSEVTALGGVLDAALVMATDLNRDLLRDSGLLIEEQVAAGPNDLLIAIRAKDDAAASAALQATELLLARRRPAPEASTQQQPRSLRSAHRADPEAALALISVPGPYAAAEARQALTDGLHVFLFSDNVSLEDEVELKRRARDRGLLVMGPDCGTAILNGVGFGFANLVRRGSIGVIGASGTGIQELVCLLDQAGEGISHALGTGGRDLYPAVRGITTLQAIDLLRDDPATRSIVLLSKAADADVAAEVLSALAATGKRSVAYVQGEAVLPTPGVELTSNLEDAARLAASAWSEPPPDDVPSIRLLTGQRQARGLYCGGTLCQEAAAVFGTSPSSDHEFIDFGDDRYTRGRAHPILDPTLRNQAIVQAGADARVAVVLLDIILGLAAHPDPAGATVPAIREAKAAAAAAGRELAIFAHIVGTSSDPQDLAQQKVRLRSAGVYLFASNVQVARAASHVVEGVAV